MVYNIDQGNMEYLAIFGALALGYLVLTPLMVATASYESLVLHRINELSRQRGIQLTPLERDALILSISDQCRQLKADNPRLQKVFILQYLNSAVDECLDDIRKRA